MIRRPPRSTQGVSSAASDVYRDRMGIPAFVASLAAMLVFRGALLMVTEGTGTIVISNKAFNAIGNGFIPDFVNMGNLHVLTLIIGIVGIAAYIWSEIKTRNDKIKYNFEVISIIQPNMNHELFDPKPNDLKALENSKLFFSSSFEK